MYIDVQVKYPLFLADFNETWIFPRHIFKKTQIPNFMKFRPVGAQLLHANRRTDMTKVTFRNFAKAPKQQKKYPSL